jgi:hypothetical protein
VGREGTRPDRVGEHGDVIDVFRHIDNL